MAYPVQITLGTGNTVSLNFQSQNVAVSVTYQLEREDTDLLALVQEKTSELAQAHRLAWQGLHDAKVSPAQSAMLSPVQTPPESPPSVDSQEEQLQELSAEELSVAEEITDATPHATAQKNGARPAPLPPDGGIEPKAPLEKAPLEPATLGQRGALRVLLDQAGWQKERITAHLHAPFGCERIEDLTAAQATEWLLELQRAARVANEQQRLQTSRNGAKTGTSKTDNAKQERK